MYVDQITQKSIILARTRVCVVHGVHSMRLGVDYDWNEDSVVGVYYLSQDTQTDRWIDGER